MLAVVATSYSILTGTGGSAVLPDLESEALRCLRSPNPCKKQEEALALHYKRCFQINLHHQILLMNHKRF